MKQRYTAKKIILETREGFSNQVILKWLHQDDLYARRSTMCIPLAPKHNKDWIKVGEVGHNVIDTVLLLSPIEYAAGNSSLKLTSRSYRKYPSTNKSC